MINKNPSIGTPVYRVTPNGAVTTYANAVDGINKPVSLIFNSTGDLFVIGRLADPITCLGRL
jgi:hypothetical protein